MTHEAVNADSKQVWQTRKSEKVKWIEFVITLLMMTSLMVARQVKKMKEQHKQAPPLSKTPPTLKTCFPHICSQKFNSPHQCSHYLQVLSFGHIAEDKLSNGADEQRQDDPVGAQPGLV